LKKLMADESGPFVTQLSRRPGHKESRYAHLFCHVDDSVDAAESPVTDLPIRQADEDNRRIDILEKKVEELHAALSDLRDQFVKFKQEIE
jgi:uncharacterized protein